jgi:carbamoyl-phosphate synthase large subunit
MMLLRWEFHCRIHEITKIDMWFLKQYEELYVLERKKSLLIRWMIYQELLLEETKDLPTDKLHMVRCLESEVHTLRTDMNINRVFKLVDTCSGGIQSQNTLLLTFEAEIEKADGTRYVDNESVVTDKRR